MTSCYWGSSSSAAERHDPSLPYLEQYRIDPIQFAQLFLALAPWVCGSHTPIFSSRLFRLLDQNQDGLVNFKEFITGLSEFTPDPRDKQVPSSSSTRFHLSACVSAGGMYHGDMTEKLKLLYKLHLQPGNCSPGTRFLIRTEPSNELHSADPETS